MKYENPFKITDVTELSQEFTEDSNILSSLLFSFVKLELPYTAQTVYNVGKLNNSVRLAVDSDNYEAIEALFADSDFSIIRDFYSEFIILDYSEKTALINKLSQRLSELGYILDGDEYFVA